MNLIAIENLRQGMVVGQDVRDINSRLLISKGQELTEKHLRVLKSWGVAEIRVVSGAENQPKEYLPTDVDKAKRIKATLDFMFRDLDITASPVKEVYQMAFLHRYRLDNDPKQMVMNQRPERPSSGKKEDIRKKMQRVNVHLPEAPEIITELNEVIADPLGTSHDIAQVVNKSPSLAAILLKLVNSAFYGFPAKIDRISRAVSLIGSKEISNLALGVCVMRAFKDISPEVIEVPVFMRHSVACGLIARIMGARQNMKDTEQLFVAGLLHDIGKLIVYKYFPDGAIGTFAAAGAAQDAVYRCERSVLGLHHTQVGKLLLNKWQLPPDLEDVIVHHHTPSRAIHGDKAVIIQMADMLVNTLGVGSSGEWMVPQFDHPAWAMLGLANVSIATIVYQALHQLQSLDGAFNPQ